MAALLLFSLISWLCRGTVEAHVPATCVGIFGACAVSNAALFPSASLFILIQAVAAGLSAPLVSLCGAAGASLGEMTGYYVGRRGGPLVRRKYDRGILRHLPRHSPLWVFLFSLLPVPVFDVIGIVAGAGQMDAKKFYLSCFAGKFIKMLVVAAVAKDLLLLLRF